MPYRLVFKNIGGIYDPCFYCRENRCDGCAIPYTEMLTIEELLKKVKLQSNDTYFYEDRLIRGKEL